MLEVSRIEVRLDVMDRYDRLLEAHGKSLRHVYSNEQGARKARTVGDGDCINVIHCARCIV
jgi:hypothetical protein